MASWSDFVDGLARSGATAVATGEGPPIIARFSEPAAEHRALSDGVALVDRSYRGLLEITGADRASWLHNLTTNEVKRLSPGEGNYAFALNVQGRIQFDLNILVQRECIWLDVDRRFMPLATKHFGKYTIAEDVRVADRGTAFVRLALVGELVKAALRAVGAAQVANLPWFATAGFDAGGHPLTAIRTDFCGCFGLELLVEADHAVDLWRFLTDSAGPVRAIAVGDEAVQVRRIEAGIPWPLREITDEVLPAETRQLGRAVSYQKGCYLGQEVVERMRSRGVVARQLVGVRIDGETVPAVPAEVTSEDGKPAGRLTSVCRSPRLGGVIGLGYVRTPLAVGGTHVRVATDGGSLAATVAELPF